jgi:queuine/archaeosine tRNA-ribosyltransferase
MDAATANAINRRTLDHLRRIPLPSTVFVNLGKDYLPAICGIEGVFGKTRIVFAKGGIGLKMAAMKVWLTRLPSRNAYLNGATSRKQPYLYFFPDWDDFVYEPFSSVDRQTGERRYAHELCGRRTPFDGILLSLSHLEAGKGALHRFTGTGKTKVSLRRRLHLPRDLLLFGDCGAFSYVNESMPPISSARAAELYDHFGFDFGASVDHIPLQEIEALDATGRVTSKMLDRSSRYKRMYLTRDNAYDFLAICRRRRYRFTPLGVVQGLGTRTYVQRAQEYVDMGYEHIAIGGLVPRSDPTILEIVCAVRRAIQDRTRGSKRNIWLHLFGILRPKLQPLFRELGISSFDSASYFRKAWLRSDQNYLAPDGRRWYGTIRVPISSSGRLDLTSRAQGISDAQLVKREKDCLVALEECDTDRRANSKVVRAINRYGPLLIRRGEENHFAKKHSALLLDRPWERCSCPFCRSAGIHVVVFRGASRNKRRGLHNTWVFYHKILHGDAIPGSSVAADE